MCIRTTIASFAKPWAKNKTTRFTPSHKLGGATARHELSAHRRIDLLRKSDRSHRPSSKSLSLPSATQGKQQEVRLTTVDLDPIFAENQSFGDRKSTLHGSATELVGRREAGNNLFGPQFTRQWSEALIESIFLSFTFGPVPDALTTSELMEEISSN